MVEGVVFRKIGVVCIYSGTRLKEEILTIAIYCHYIIHKESIMAQTGITNLNIRIDRTTKESAESIFDEMGLNMTSAITMFLRQTVRDRRLPFTADLNVYGPETIKAIEEGRRIARDPEVNGYSSIEDLRNALEV